MLPRRFFQYPILLFLLVCASTPSLMAQNYSGHNWYFGNSTPGLGIRFNRTTNAPSIITDKTVPFNIGGSAVASDPANGNLLFYTDGSTLFDATHQIMPNGNALGGNPNGNQPVVIAKAPDLVKSKRYYVITNNASFTTGGTISYRIVDMNAFGNAIFPSPALGQGETATNTAVAGLTGRSEAMIVIPHANGEDFWLITHANGTPDFTVTPFTAAGPGTSLVFPGLGLIEVAANFSYHPGTGRLAVSPQEDTRDIEILDFDDTNGVLSNPQRVLNSGLASTGTQTIFDTEFSNNGQYLYYSVHGEAGIQADVLQYDIQNSLNSITSVLPVPNTISRSFGLQMAPDSAIYHLYQATAGGPFLVGSLTNTDTIASEVNYSPAAFGAALNFNGMQFPSFAPQDSVLLTVDFTSRGTCSNAPTSFFPTVSPSADSLVWRFGDGNVTNAWSPVHVYESGGTFTVRLTAFLSGDSAFVEHPVTIEQFDLTLQLVQDTTACACELPINNGEPLLNGGNCPDDTSDDFSVDVTANGGSPTFQWFGPSGALPGQTSATLRPDSAGYYYVVATIGACAAYAGINIKEYDSLDQRANIWYFGQNAGLDFNGLPNDPVVGIAGPLNTPEGCSVICDRNGQVIFSTDGQRIYDKDDNEIAIPVPPGLGGEPGATQSALIMPVAGDETLFYIFTTQEVHGSGTYEVRYSLFDLKLNNGQGGLQEFNQLLFSRSTERLTGNANWLIAHEYGNNSFRAYPVGQNGIGTPTISAIGSDHSTSVAENGQGYMELGAQNRLAVALSNPGTSNVVEVFDFIDSTGTVTNFRRMDTRNTTGQVYGIEVSPAGNKVFASVIDGANSQIVEFAFDTLGMPYFQQAVNFTGQLGAIQTGPDGQIYVAINGSTTLGTFQANEDTTQITPFPVPLQPSVPLAAGTTSLLGLPNFTQIISNPISTPGFDFAGICLGDSTAFNGVGKDPAIDQFDWTFGDGSGATDAGPQVMHLYQTAGTYTVTLRIYNKCEPAGYATFTQDITIVAPPPNPSQGVTLCAGPVVLDANPTNAPNLTFEWSTDETTRTITVDQQSTYTVTITDANGCTTDGQFLTADNRPQLDFGPDLTLCQNVPVAPLNAQNPGTTYQWTVNGSNTGSTIQTQGVDTSTPGVFEYEVTVTDPITTCFAVEDITYTINESPAFTAVPTNPTSCAAADGTINLTITAPAGRLFTYFITGPSSASNTDQPVSPPSILTTGLDAGTYGVTVSDQVSGCATITTVTINDPAFTVSGVQSTNCDPIFINVTVNPTPGPLAPPFSYRVIDVSTGLEVQPSTNPGSQNFTTSTPLPSNNEQYIVEVSNNGCTASSPPIDVDEDQTVPATFIINSCDNPVTIQASQGDTFAWSGDPSLNITPGTANTATVSANPPQGNQTINVLITQAGFCNLDTAIVFNVNNNIVAAFTQTDPCADQITLSATPVGPYTYRWLRNGTIDNTIGGATVVLTQASDDDLFQVQLVNTITGCVFNSDPAQQVEIEGDLQVTLASTPPCEGTPFTLTAGSNLTPVTFAWTIDGSPIAGQTSNTLVDTRSGLYEVTVTKDVCVERVPFNIVVNPTTPGLLTDTGIICPEAPPGDPAATVELDAGPGFVLYQWYQDGVAVPTATGQTFLAEAVGTYRVELLNIYQCASSDETVLVEECDPRITGPNAFRPGSGVGANQAFGLFTFFIADENFEVFIFNRWGEMIFSSTERDFRWNGGYNNNLARPMPPGTYSYLVKYKSSYRPEDGILEKRGGVVLLR